MARIEGEPPRWLLGVSLPGGVRGRHFLEETGAIRSGLRAASAAVGALALAFSLALVVGAWLGVW